MPDELGRPLPAASDDKSPQHAGPLDRILTDQEIPCQATTLDSPPDTDGYFPSPIENRPDRRVEALPDFAGIAAAVAAELGQDRSRLGQITMWDEVPRQLRGLMQPFWQHVAYLKQQGEHEAVDACFAEAGIAGLREVFQAAHDATARETAEHRAASWQRNIEYLTEHLHTNLLRSRHEVSAEEFKALQELASQAIAILESADPVRAELHLERFESRSRTDWLHRPAPEDGSPTPHRYYLAHETGPSLETQWVPYHTPERLAAQAHFSITYGQQPWLFAQELGVSYPHSPRQLRNWRGTDPRDKRGLIKYDFGPFEKFVPAPEPARGDAAKPLEPRVIAEVTVPHAVRNRDILRTAITGMTGRPELGLMIDGSNNAAGHGLDVLTALDSAAAVMKVSSIAQGIELRGQGVRTRIVATDFSAARDLTAAIRHGIEVTVAAPRDWLQLCAAADGAQLPARAWAEVELGGGQLSPELHKLAAFARQTSDHVCRVTGVCGTLLGPESPLFAGDEAGYQRYLDTQHQLFAEAAALFEPRTEQAPQQRQAATLTRHLGMSLDLLRRRPELAGDVVNPGHALWGLPASDFEKSLGLVPVMEIRLKVAGEVLNVPGGANYRDFEPMTQHGATDLLVGASGYGALPFLYGTRALARVAGSLTEAAADASMDHSLWTDPGGLRRWPRPTDLELVSSGADGPGADQFGIRPAAVTAAANGSQVHNIVRRDDWGARAVPPSVSSRAPDATAHIAVDQITARTREAVQRFPGVRIIVAVKDDGYGYGLLNAARAALAGGAHGLAVGTVEEAIVLAKAGLSCASGAKPRIVCWQPSTDTADPETYRSDVTAAAEHGIELTLRTPGQVRQLVAASKSSPVAVRVEIDETLHRGGVRVNDQLGSFLLTLAEAQSTGHLKVTTIFQHPAAADPKSPLNDSQHELQKWLLNVTRRFGLDVDSQMTGSRIITVPAAEGRDAQHEINPGTAIYLGEPGEPDSFWVSAEIARVEPAASGHIVPVGAGWRAREPGILATINVGEGAGLPPLVGSRVRAGEHYGETVAMDDGRIVAWFPPAAPIKPGGVLTVLGSDDPEQPALPAASAGPGYGKDAVVIAGGLRLPKRPAQPDAARRPAELPEPSFNAEFRASKLHAHAVAEATIEATRGRDYPVLNRHELRTLSSRVWRMYKDGALEDLAGAAHPALQQLGAALRELDARLELARGTAGGKPPGGQPGRRALNTVRKLLRRIDTESQDPEAVPHRGLAAEIAYLKRCRADPAYLTTREHETLAWMFARKFRSIGTLHSAAAPERADPILVLIEEALSGIGATDREMDRRLQRMDALYNEWAALAYEQDLVVAGTRELTAKGIRRLAAYLRGKDLDNIGDPAARKALRFAKTQRNETPAATMKTSELATFRRLYDGHDTRESARNSGINLSRAQLDAIDEHLAAGGVLHVSPGLWDAGDPDHTDAIAMARAVQSVYPQARMRIQVQDRGAGPMGVAQARELLAREGFPACEVVAESALAAPVSATIAAAAAGSIRLRQPRPAPPLPAELSGAGWEAPPAADEPLIHEAPAGYTLTNLRPENPLWLSVPVTGDAGPTSAAIWAMAGDPSVMQLVVVPCKDRDQWDQTWEIQRVLGYAPRKTMVILVDTDNFTPGQLRAQVTGALKAARAHHQTTAKQSPAPQPASMRPGPGSSADRNYQPATPVGRLDRYVSAYPQVAPIPPPRLAANPIGA